MKELLRPINLTTEQKEELIDLCEKTWTEYEFWWYAGTHNIGYTNGDGPTNTIYWFEFVVRMAIDENNDDFLNFYNSL